MTYNVYHITCDGSTRAYPEVCNMRRILYSIERVMVTSCRPEDIQHVTYNVRRSTLIKQSAKEFDIKCL